ncbi:hypothetical protein GGD67_002268 [Bradyrhizobium sp. IAR9]|uniref:hypothetical protein n=1 Tax=Bradyrhizobium sp. IAR9 TaxID=2663841 RepID=UPI0015C747E7|nr:hypothetical protein [Bradyrhizobium sp. IAR9]NYG44820.1 hypothetical protein [Bradyrhizobium sp. IAR9]
MPKRKNTIRDLVGDAPARAPGLASERGFDADATAPGALWAERQSLRQSDRSRPDSSARATLKERAHQMSLYLEPATYDALREIAHRERTKMHVLLLEAVGQFLKNRVTPPQ